MCHFCRHRHRQRWVLSTTSYLANAEFNFRYAYSVQYSPHHTPVKLNSDTFLYMSAIKHEYTLQYLASLAKHHSQLVIENPSYGITTFARFCEISGLHCEVTSPHKCDLDTGIITINTTLTDATKVYVCRDIAVFIRSYQELQFPSTIKFIRLRSMGHLSDFKSQRPLYCITCMVEKTTFKTTANYDFVICQQCNKIKQDLYFIDILLLLSAITPLIYDIRIHIARFIYIRRS